MPVSRILAVSLTLAILLPQLPDRARLREPRNLLVITLDTMRADRLEMYGFSGVETPALERIANEGLVFDEAFAAVPLTLPSHASIFTGIYPFRLGVRDNAGAPVPTEFTTLAERLRLHGLRTSAFVASAVLAPDRGLAQGFDVYSAGTSPRCPGMPARRQATTVVDEAIEWLRANDSRRFFTWIHLFDTHRPYDLPAEFRDTHYDPYLAAIQYEDAQISRLIAHLESRNLLANTLIVVAGDHGESLGDHGEDGHGIFVYQETLRVPLLMRGPGIVAGRTSSVARLIDVTPTVLTRFGIADSSMDGIDLLRADRGMGSEVYAESMYPLRFGWAPLRSLRADRYKLIEAPRPELYDLLTDPGEERNVVDRHPAVAAAMRARLKSFSTENPREGAATNADTQLVERLASLGYVGQTAPATGNVAGGQVDPKDRIADFNRITARQWEQGEHRRALCR